MSIAEKSKKVKAIYFQNGVPYPKFELADGSVKLPVLTSNGVKWMTLEEQHEAKNRKV